MNKLGKYLRLWPLENTPLCYDVIKWKHFSRYCPLVQGIHRSPVDSPHKGRVTRTFHDDVIKWKHFPRNWPFVREIHRSPVNFPHKGQWRGALMFSLIYAWINDWVNNREAGELRRQHGHYDVIVMHASLQLVRTNCWANTGWTNNWRLHGGHLTSP